MESVELFKLMRDIVTKVELKEKEILQSLKFPKVTHRELRFLLLTKFLKSKDKNTSKQLTMEMNISPSATSFILRSLEENLYIYRLHDVDDRRIIYVELTKQANKFLSNYLKLRQQYYDSIMGSFEQRSLDNILMLLIKMKEDVNRLQ